MRLVNADSIISFMRDWQAEVTDDRTCNILDMIIRGVENEPTAFDLESVLNEINAKARTMSTSDVPHKYYKAIGTRICEEIIRRGGVDVL